MSITPTWQRGDVQLYLGDCRELLPQFAPGSIDAVVTDPPYGIGFAASPTKWSRDNLNRQKDVWDDVAPEKELVRKIVGIAPECLMWGGNHFDLPPSRGWLVWIKPKGLPTYGTAEMCWTNIEMPVRHIEYKRSCDEKADHPTQKPLPVMEWCIGFIEGQTILDPFMGSGTTGVAAVKLGRKFIGIEIEPKYFEIAVRRISEAQDQFELFEPVPPPVKQADLFGGGE